MSTLTAPAALNAEHPAGQIVLTGVAMTRTSALAGYRMDRLYHGLTTATLIRLDESSCSEMN